MAKTLTSLVLVNINIATASVEALNWLVCRCLLPENLPAEEIVVGNDTDYCTNPSLSQRIIDKHIGTVFENGSWIAFYVDDKTQPDAWDLKFRMTGETQLVAAMRCFLVAKKGYTGEVPVALSGLYKPIFNHLFTVAFTVNTHKTGEYVPREEILKALQKRVDYLRNFPERVSEAVGPPQNTYEVDPTQAENLAASGAL